MKSIQDYIKVLPDQTIYILAIDGEVLDAPLKCPLNPLDETGSPLYCQMGAYPLGAEARDKTMKNKEIK